MLLTEEIGLLFLGVKEQSKLRVCILFQIPGFRKKNLYRVSFFVFLLLSITVRQKWI